MWGEGEIEGRKREGERERGELKNEKRRWGERERIGGYM